MPSKPLTIAPLTGVLDLRSSPDELPADALRLRQNLQCAGDKKLRRGSGFSKLFDTANYNNSDFHDQLLSLSGGVRQPITLLYEAVSTQGNRSLILGKQSALAELNTHSGSYRILGSGFGGTAGTSASAPRFKAGRLGDYVIFTNDLDKVQYMRLGQGPDLDTGDLLYSIPDLDTIGVRRAAVIWVWKNVLFLANVEMDGERVGYRIIWSDFDRPLGFDPANLQSITGLKDLYTHETILAGAPIGNSFMIYTTHGIWEMIAVGGDQSFDFRRVFNADKEEIKGTLAYPNTLCDLHDSHWYVGRDGIYTFNPYMGAPDRPEWLHRSTSDMLDNIDSAACQAHIACNHGDEIYFSVARTGAANQCPDYTLRVNKTYKVSDVVDHGFTAITQYSPQDTETIRDFIVENKICTLAGLASAGYPYGDEALPRVLPTGTADYTPGHIYTDQTQDVNDGFGSTITVEDWTETNASAESLCGLLGGVRLDEICRKCKVTPILVAASSTDWCVKQLGSVFYREICLNPTATGVSSGDGYTASLGSYELQPITSLLRFGPAFSPDQKVLMDQLVINFLAQSQVSPLGIALRIGISAQPADPNTGTGMVWHQHSTQLLKYATLKSQTQHLADNTQPTERAHWHFWREGRYLYVELSIAGVGGDALFSGIEPSLKIAGTTINY